jgi:hypothetical protein
VQDARPPEPTRDLEPAREVEVELATVEPPSVPPQVGCDAGRACGAPAVPLALSSPPVAPVDSAMAARQRAALSKVNLTPGPR